MYTPTDNCQHLRVKEKKEKKRKKEKKSEKERNKNSAPASVLTIVSSCE